MGRVKWFCVTSLVLLGADTFPGWYSVRMLKTHYAGVAENFFVKGAAGLDPGV